MYVDHKVFVQPRNENIKLWRYIDFTKFVSLLDTRRLFFTRADKFNDPFEGSWPKKNVQTREYFLTEKMPPEAKEKTVQFLKETSIRNKDWLRYHAINCWHMNEQESAAMWKLYLKSDEGVAIQTTYAKLKKSIIDDEDIYLGFVNYIDYENDYMVPDNFIFTPFIHKRKSFSHEQEVRAIISKFPVKDNHIDFTLELIENGIPVKVDLENLIEHIYIPPDLAKWFKNLVEAIISRYGYKFKVEQSDLNKEPLF